ncbi:unnamed protein product [Mytilus coruscus]|uniref:Uncharacterized protein n=1 Tax=Mytilus coruscus TaxID=42192 RepID=A0A6J8DKF8_MYTCO|nr:unnamed protein product [Mytilus coruscus]
MDFSLLLILTCFAAVIEDDIGFLSCGNYTMQPENYEDWYVRVGSDEKGTVKGYNFWFLIFKDARFNFERIEDDEPYFYISTERWNDYDCQEKLNGDWENPVMLERQLTAGNSMVWALRVSFSKCGFREGTPRAATTQNEETQENPSQDTNHSARNLSATVSFHDSSQSLNSEEHITQQRQETSHQEERIAWPKMNNEAQWRDLNDDLGVILETSHQVCVERRIETLTTLVYNIGKEIFSVEERKDRSNINQTPNSREHKIKQLRKELKDQNRRYNRSNEIEKLGISCITDRIRDELRRTRRAEQFKNSNKKKAKNRANFIKDPYNYTLTLLMEKEQVICILVRKK